MTRMIVSGCCGYMGRVIADIAKGDPDVSIIAGFDIAGGNQPCFPVFSAPAAFEGRADVVVDFSHPSALAPLLEFGASAKTPLVLCTTGYSDDEISAIENAALEIPIFKSGNMSLGINLLADLVKRAAAVLGDGFDVEIIERHHNRKIDAPSGTALMLADAAAAAMQDEPEYVFERRSKSRRRGENEIGISSVRGGTIVGEHEVIFAGLDEVVELRHTAASRDVFAAGALRAAKFLAAVKTPGLYNMGDVLV